MKNLPLEHYPPLARKAIIFLNSAKSAYEIPNRRVGSEEAYYYQLSQAVELSIKALVKKETGKAAPRTHDKQELAEQYQGICGFSGNEIDTIVKLKQLNNGPGGLRYDNEPIGEFIPSTFQNGVKIVERLLQKFE
jgi:HEPN domain-containing protein